MLMPSPQFETYNPPSEDKEGYICQFCTNSVGPTDFHDCKGKYDEVRYHNGYNLPRSGMKRLYNKYQTQDKQELNRHVENYKTQKHTEWVEKEYTYSRLRDAQIKKVKTIEFNFEEEEELWNS